MCLTHWLRNRFLLIVTFFLTIHFISCADKSIPDTSDRIIASVFNKKLLFSEVEDLIPAVNSNDSLVAMNNLINRWIKKSLMMREAEKNIPKELNIEQLVNDYRESLILNNYEQLLVEKNLDTLISEEEFQQYYESNKSQYILKYTIIQCLLLKIPRDHPNVSSIRQKAKSDDPNIEELQSLSNGSSVIALLEPYRWHKALDIIDLMPANSVRISDLTKNRLIDVTNDDDLYLLKILAKVPAANTAPLSYIKDQITRLILHQRRINLLENINELLYERELKNNNIKIYSE